MLRILSTIAPRVAVRAAAPTLAVRAAPCVCARAVRRLHSSAAASAAAPRREAEQQEEAEEEEEETREVVPFPEARSKLVTVVAQEIASFDTSDQFVDQYCKETGLRVSVNLDTETVVATRDSHDHKVQISFRAEALEPDEQEQEQEQEQESQKLPEHRFAVDITAPNGSVLRLECFNSPEGELEVGAISFPSEVSADPATAPSLSPEAEANAARDSLRVEDMSEESSEAFFDFCESIGVDDDLAVFVSSQAQLVRTQAMVARLNKLKNFAQ